MNTNIYRALDFDPILAVRLAGTEFSNPAEIADLYERGVAIQKFLEPEYVNEQIEKFEGSTFSQRGIIEFGNCGADNLFEVISENLKNDERILSIFKRIAEGMSDE
jgi:hypothetical protein